MKHRRVILMIPLSWAIPIVFVSIKSSLLLSFKAAFSIFIWLVMIFFGLLPCLMSIFCFVSMLGVVCKHKRAARTLAKQLRFNNHVLCRPRKKTAINIMAIVIGVFLLCCGIQLRFGFQIVSFNHIEKLCNVYHLQLPFLAFNSAVNPLAYALFKRDIKKELNRLMAASS